MPPPKPGGRPAKYDRRAVADGTPYVARAGGAGRWRPTDRPSYRACFHHVRLWQRDGTWGRTHAARREEVRRSAGKRRRPTAGLPDSRTTGATEPGGPKGYGGGKRAVGRKRRPAVDTLGLAWAVVVTPASAQDRGGGRAGMLRGKLAAPRLSRVCADSAYRGCGCRAAWLARLVVWVVVRKPAGPGPTVPPRRWVVERTVGWLGRWRRPAKDHERTGESAEAFATVAAIGLMARRLQPPET